MHTVSLFIDVYIMLTLYLPELPMFCVSRVHRMFFVMGCYFVWPACLYVYVCCTPNGVTCRCMARCQAIYVSGFDKGTHLSIFVDFELVVLGGSTVDELFVALCCASIAAPISEVCSLKVRTYACCNYEKTARNASIVISVNMATA